LHVFSKLVEDRLERRLAAQAVKGVIVPSTLPPPAGR
jgi:hypothetical protein